MVKKISKIFKWFIIMICFICGLVLVFHKQIRSAIVAYNTKQVLNSSIQQSKPLSSKKATYRYENIKPIDTPAVLKKESSNKKMTMGGKIAIPSVKILLPIFEGVTNQNLSLGAGTMKPNQEMGKQNYALASHNMNDDKTLFSPLLHIKVGARIYLTNGQSTYIYRVNTKKYIEPDQVEVVENRGNDKKITLITCSMDGKQRLLVQGTLIRTENQVVDCFKK